MRLQLLSDLHLETETYDPQPLPGAELLVLAGDIDATWAAFDQFKGWPVPVLMVAGNHEFDGRELDEAWPRLRERCAECGIRLLERESLVLTDAGGQRVRFIGTIRWSDFDLFGATRRPQAMRAASYFLRLMDSRLGGEALDAERLRAESLACRDWLAAALAGPNDGSWDSTIVITHFGPSLRSGDPRFGSQSGTASFCNADDALIPLADLWLHGHLHCRHDYLVPRPGRAPARVVSQALGLQRKGEDRGFDPTKLIELVAAAA
ncbi:metallophosphoesterase [Aquincola sp. S2]|uniref:Metallophosphoesterase n=1 Tax=Pseudaquabacterium terrae TaxID=2732868 RepID=A0ABX2ELP0_9BURK|nr:metallophosphoesterase [Aquabacterium terrae]NRF69572.1 metallophosphoesterase [Aquabacterium terrae]